MICLWVTIRAFIRTCNFMRIFCLALKFVPRNYASVRFDCNLRAVAALRVHPAETRLTVYRRPYIGFVRLIRVVVC